MIHKLDVRDRARGACPGELPFVFGLADGVIDRNHGSDYLYVDHAYFRRGWGTGHCRMIRNAPHLTRVIHHDTDRLDKFGVVIKDYRTNGSKVVVIEPSGWLARIYKQPDIVKQMLDELSKHTDRPIVVKSKEGHLSEALKDAWAVVCPFSVAGVEAAIAGVPVFSTPNCPSWPINAGPLSAIETPKMPERREWANSLAWATWHIDEIREIDFRTYQCV